MHERIWSESTQSAIQGNLLKFIFLIVQLDLFSDVFGYYKLGSWEKTTKDFARVAKY